MDSIMLRLYSHAVVQFPASIASNHHHQKLKIKSPIFSPREIGDVPLLLVLRKDAHRRPVSNSSLDGDPEGGSYQKPSLPERRTVESDKSTAASRLPRTKVNSARQEEIISLFRRIRSSVSKGASAVSGTDEETRNSDEDKPAAESVLEIIRQSRKRAKGKVPFKRGNDLKPQQRSYAKKNGKSVEGIVPPANGFKLTRPPSNFVKRSPIPFPSAPRRTECQTNEALPATAETDTSNLQKLKEMKLPELRELAKSRGLKGYSKLKKKELVELLISSDDGLQRFQASKKKSCSICLCEITM